MQLDKSWIFIRNFFVSQYMRCRGQDAVHYGKTGKVHTSNLVIWKKSTRNLNKLFHKFSILICVFFVFLWHVLNFSYACYHTNICIRVNGVHEIAHLQFYCDCPCVCVPFFYNQIIDGNMSIIQLTAFLFIEWKYTKKNTYEICAHKIIRKQKKTTTNIKTIKCYSYWMIVKHTLIIKENQFFSFSLSSFINEFVSYENCNYFSNGRKKNCPRNRNAV